MLARQHMIAYLDLGLDSICLLGEVLKVIPANGHSRSHQLSATTLLLRIPQGTHLPLLQQWGSRAEQRPATLWLPQCRVSTQPHAQ